MTKRHTVGGFVFCLALALALSACAGAGPEPEGTSVRLAMGYLPNVQFAPYYVAQEKGYFAQNGIDVEFDHSVFEADAVKLVGSGELQFANVSGEQVLLARAQGIPLVYVFEWWQKYPIGVVSKAGTGIAGPADLAGRTVGLPMQSGASYVGWRALLAETGLSEDDVSTQVVGFTQAAAVSEDTVDAAVVYANNEPLQLEQAGFDVNVIYVSDYVDLVANGLVTSEALLAENPDLVSGMVDALARGLADVLADPDAAFVVCQGYVEGLEGEAAGVQRSVLDASIEMWQGPRAGYSELASWERTQAVLLDIGLLNEPQDLAAAFTNQFVP